MLWRWNGLDMESECEDRRIVKLRCYNLLNQCRTDKLWFMGRPKLSRSSCFVCRSQRNIANKWRDVLLVKSALKLQRETRITPRANYKSNVWIIEWSIQNMDFPLGCSSLHNISLSLWIPIDCGHHNYSCQFKIYYLQHKMPVLYCSVLNLCARHRFANYKIYTHLSHPRSCRIDDDSGVARLLLLLLSSVAVRTTIHRSNNNSANNHFHRRMRRRLSPSLVFASRQIGKQIINRQTGGHRWILLSCLGGKLPLLIIFLVVKRRLKIV